MSKPSIKIRSTKWKSVSHKILKYSEITFDINCSSCISMPISVPHSYVALILNIPRYYVWHITVVQECCQVVVQLCCDHHVTWSHYHVASSTFKALSLVSCKWDFKGYRCAVEHKYFTESILTWGSYRPAKLPHIISESGEIHSHYMWFTLTPYDLTVLDMKSNGVKFITMFWLGITFLLSKQLKYSNISHL